MKNFKALLISFVLIVTLLLVFRTSVTDENLPPATPEVQSQFTGQTKLGNLTVFDKNDIQPACSGTYAMPKNLSPDNNSFSFALYADRPVAVSQLISRIEPVNDFYFILYFDQATQEWLEIGSSVFGTDVDKVGISELNKYVIPANNAVLVVSQNPNRICVSDRQKKFTTQENLDGWRMAFVPGVQIISSVRHAFLLSDGGVTEGIDVEASNFVFNKGLYWLFYDFSAPAEVIADDQELILSEVSSRSQETVFIQAGEQQVLDVGEFSVVNPDAVVDKIVLALGSTTVEEFKDTVSQVILEFEGETFVIETGDLDFENKTVTIDLPAEFTQALSNNGRVSVSYTVDGQADNVSVDAAIAMQTQGSNEPTDFVDLDELELVATTIAFNNNTDNVPADRTIIQGRNTIKLLDFSFGELQEVNFNKIVLSPNSAVGDLDGLEIVLQASKAQEQLEFDFVEEGSDYLLDISDDLQALILDDAFNYEVFVSFDADENFFNSTASLNLSTEVSFALDNTEFLVFETADVSVSGATLSVSYAKTASFLNDADDQAEIVLEFEADPNVEMTAFEFEADLDNIALEFLDSDLIVNADDSINFNLSEPITEFGNNLSIIVRYASNDPDDLDASLAFVVSDVLTNAYNVNINGGIVNITGGQSMFVSAPAEFTSKSVVADIGLNQLLAPGNAYQGNGMRASLADFSLESKFVNQINAVELKLETADVPSILYTGSDFDFNLCLQANADDAEACFPLALNIESRFVLSEGSLQSLNSVFAEQNVTRGVSFVVEHLGLADFEGVDLQELFVNLVPSYVISYNNGKTFDIPAIELNSLATNKLTATEIPEENLSMYGAEVDADRHCNVTEQEFIYTLSQPLALEDLDSLEFDLVAAEGLDLEFKINNDPAIPLTFNGDRTQATVNLADESVGTLDSFSFTMLEVDNAVSFADNERVMDLFDLQNTFFNFTEDDTAFVLVSPEVGAKCLLSEVVLNLNNESHDYVIAQGALEFANFNVAWSNMQDINNLKLKATATVDGVDVNLAVKSADEDAVNFIESIDEGDGLALANVIEDQADASEGIHDFVLRGDFAALNSNDEVSLEITVSDDVSGLSETLDRTMTVVDNSVVTITPELRFLAPDALLTQKVATVTVGNYPGILDSMTLVNTGGGFTPKIKLDSGAIGEWFAVVDNVWTLQTQYLDDLEGQTFEVEYVFDNENVLSDIHDSIEIVYADELFKNPTSYHLGVLNINANTVSGGLACAFGDDYNLLGAVHPALVPKMQDIVLVFDTDLSATAPQLAVNYDEDPVVLDAVLTEVVGTQFKFTLPSHPPQNLNDIELTLAIDESARDAGESFNLQQFHLYIVGVDEPVIVDLRPDSKLFDCDSDVIVMPELVDDNRDSSLLVDVVNDFVKVFSFTIAGEQANTFERLSFAKPVLVSDLAVDMIDEPNLMFELYLDDLPVGEFVVDNGDLVLSLGGLEAINNSDNYNGSVYNVRLRVEEELDAGDFINADLQDNWGSIEFGRVGVLPSLNFELLDVEVVGLYGELNNDTEYMSYACNFAQARFPLFSGLPADIEDRLDASEFTAVFDANVPAAADVSLVRTGIDLFLQINQNLADGSSFDLIGLRFKEGNFTWLTLDFAASPKTFDCSSGLNIEVIDPVPGENDVFLVNYLNEIELIRFSYQGDDSDGNNTENILTKVSIVKPELFDSSDDEHAANAANLFEHEDVAFVSYTYGVNGLELPRSEFELNEDETKFVLPASALRCVLRAHQCSIKLRNTARVNNGDYHETDFALPDVVFEFEDGGIISRPLASVDFVDLDTLVEEETVQMPYACIFEQNTSYSLVTDIPLIVSENFTPSFSDAETPGSLAYDDTGAELLWTLEDDLADGATVRLDDLRFTPLRGGLNFMIDFEKEFDCRSDINIAKVPRDDQDELLVQQVGDQAVVLKFTVDAEFLLNVDSPDLESVTFSKPHFVSDLGVDMIEQGYLGFSLYYNAAEVGHFELDGTNTNMLLDADGMTPIRNLANLNSFEVRVRTVGSMPAADTFNGIVNDLGDLNFNFREGGLKTLAFDSVNFIDLSAITWQTNFALKDFIFDVEGDLVQGIPQFNKSVIIGESQIPVLANAENNLLLGSYSIPNNIEVAAGNVTVSDGLIDVGGEISILHHRIADNNVLDNEISVRYEAVGELIEVPDVYVLESLDYNQDELFANTIRGSNYCTVLDNTPIEVFPFVNQIQGEGLGFNFTAEDNDTVLVMNRGRVAGNELVDYVDSFTLQASRFVNGSQLDIQLREDGPILEINFDCGLAEQQVSFEDDSPPYSDLIFISRLNDVHVTNKLGIPYSDIRPYGYYGDSSITLQNIVEANSAFSLFGGENFFGSGSVGQFILDLASADLNLFERVGTLPGRVHDGFVPQDMFNLDNINGIKAGWQGAAYAQDSLLVVGFEQLTRLKSFSILSNDEWRGFRPDTRFTFVAGEAEIPVESVEVTDQIDETYLYTFDLAEHDKFDELELRFGITVDSPDEVGVEGQFGMIFNVKDGNDGSEFALDF